MNPIRRVSIIEDQAATVRRWREIISVNPGFCVASVHPDGEHALREWPSTAIDIALVDLRLPGRLDGIACISALKTKWPNLRCLIVTFSQNSVDLFKGLKAGADGYLTKDSTEEELMSALIDVMNERAPMSPGVARKVLQHFRNAPLALDAGANLVAGLTPRELGVLERLATGETNKEIAAVLGISPSTVRLHLCSIYRKLHVSTRTAAANAFLSQRAI